jgi:peptide chain release factor 2
MGAPEELTVLFTEADSLKTMLSIEDKRMRVADFQRQMLASDFWSDQTNANKVVTGLKAIKGDVEDWDNLHKKLNDLRELCQLGDNSLAEEINAEIKIAKKEAEDLKLRVIFSGKFDYSNAILEINSGAGGTEACDWASMLYRMYFRWAEEHKCKITITEEVQGETAGLKNITMIIEGLRAYGMLKAERGVHRLVRISPFDSNKRRHTSFASVDITPEIEDDAEIEIKPEDLKVETCRSSGAGGQHVNKTDSAVRMTHIPSGIIVECQSERSQIQNRLQALRVIKSKLFKRQEEERKKTLENLSGTKSKIEWGSQIRSYVLHPYLLVKDHRTDYEEHDAKAVLDGRLDEFILTFLKQEAKG